MIFFSMFSNKSNDGLAEAASPSQVMFRKVHAGQ